MVLVEEIADDEVPETVVPKEESTKPKAEPAMKRGFLEEASGKGETLYPPEGSPEGVVAPETHKAHTEHKMNENLNEQMNRGAKENNGLELPPWYTKEYPKGCQYNSPGCTINEMETSVHGNDIKKQMTRGQRWDEATAKGLTAMRMSFMSICDEDISDLIPILKGNTDLKDLDLSHNNIKDAGVQALVGALANGAAPNLQELRIYNNDFGELGETMLTKGLPVFRKKLQIHWKEPSYAKLGGYTAPPVPNASAQMD
jgi:hypothetical protein